MASPGATPAATPAPALAAAVTPIVSGETRTLPAAAARLCALGGEAPGCGALGAGDAAALRGAADALAAGSGGDEAAVEAGVPVLARLLREWPPGPSSVAALSLARGVLLSPRGASAAAAAGLLVAVASRLADGAYAAAPRAPVVALAALANAFRHSAGAAAMARPEVLEPALRGTLRALVPPSDTDARRAAAAVLYNYSVRALGEGGVDGDTAVQLLCAALEDVGAEADVEALRRRLLAAGVLLRSAGPPLRSLAQELGFMEAVEALSGHASGDVRSLVRDVLAVAREGVA